MKRLPAYQVYLIAIAVFSFSFSMFAFISALYRVEDAGLNPLQLLLLGAALEGATLIFEVPTGIIADLYSRRLSVIIGYIIIGAGIMLEGLFAWFPTILLAQAVWGFGFTFISGAFNAWVADELGEENLTNAYARASQVGGATGLLGVLVATWIGLSSFRIPMLIAGGGIIFLGLFLAIAMPENGFKPTPQPDRSTYQKMIGTFRSGLSLVRGQTILMIIMGIGWFYGLASEGMDRLQEAHLLTNFTFPTVGNFEPVVWFAIMNVVISLVSIGTIEIVRRNADIEDARTAIRIQIASNVIIIGSVVAFGLVLNIWVAMLAAMTYRFVRGANGPLYGAWVNKQLVPEVRATVLSMLSQVDALGQLIGGPIIGVVATILSMRAGIVGVGVLLAPVLLLFAYALRLTPAGSPQHPPASK